MIPAFLGQGQRQGVIFMLLTFILWGFSPVYLSAVGYASAWELWALRSLLFVPFMTLYITWAKQWPEVLSLIRHRKRFWYTCLSAVLMASNNIIFMYIVSIGKALECSLSNFILPLMNISFGVLLFRERLNSWQWFSVLLAVLGVTALGLTTGEPPKYAIYIAILFAAYGAAHKAAGLSALSSSFLEMVLAVPLALVVLLVLHSKNLIVFGHLTFKHDALLLFSVVFFLPGYLMYNQAVKLVDFTIIGFGQYITPTLQFIFAITILNEFFSWPMFFCYLIIWLALAIFSLATFSKPNQALG
ncbi:MAG: EamA family transporter [Deltaproteobacteria bacterium]|jgi:chloramphenicol-sensitive protein RarD|nr:EamA family transporter [Deltaproteobacteria bacterium]